MSSVSCSTNWRMAQSCCSRKTESGSRRSTALSAGRCSMPDLKTTATVSIVVPFHNEEGNVTQLYSRLYAVMEKTGWGYEFIFVDDGSTDLTYKLLKELAVIDHRVSVVRLRRNFGQTAALAAGFARCNCEYVIAMDG